MGELLKSLAQDTKKIGRIGILMAVILVSAGITFMILNMDTVNPVEVLKLCKNNVQDAEKLLKFQSDFIDRALKVLGIWMGLVELGFMFYFLTNKTEAKTKDDG